MTQQHNIKEGGTYSVSLETNGVGVLVGLVDRFGALAGNFEGACACLNSSEARIFAARILDACDRLVIKQAADRFTAAYEVANREAFALAAQRQQANESE